MHAPLAANSIEHIARDEPKLFLLDARHRVERAYLLDWLRKRHARLGKSEDFDWIALPISEDRKQLRLDRLAEMLESNPDRLVLPVRIVWRIPHFDRHKAVRLRHLLLGNPRLPGAMHARAILLRNKSRAQCIIGEPARVSSLRERFYENVASEDRQDSTEFAGFVARQAGLVLDIVERGLRGSRYKVPRYVSDNIRTSGKFRNALSGLSEKQNKGLPELLEEAQKYLKEMVARPTPLFLDVRARFEKFMFGQGYDEDIVYREDELDELRRTMRQYPTLLLFTHKTYLDGATPTQLLYQQDMPMLHLFGGINLDIFGIGPMFRKSGTIFIRRSFQNNPVYKLTLRHYIAYLLEKRFPMSWAFEGTRSRLGKLMPPQYGLLKYVLDSAHDADIRDLHIVPFVTSFDVIRDVEEYATEQTGRVKKPESFSWAIGYLRSLREPMGRIYVDLGEPVVVERAPRPNDRLAMSKIAFEVAVKANAATPLTLTSLMCFALLSAAPRALTGRELRTGLKYLIGWAKKRHIRIMPDLEDSGLEGMQETVDKLVNGGILLRNDQGSRTVYAIEPDQHPIASYYRNSIIHHFLDKAIIEMALLRAREEHDGLPADIFWEETDRLRDLFKFEFFYPERAEFRDNITAELARIAPDWEVRLNAGGAELAALIRRCQPMFCQGVFRPFVESYSVVLDILARLEPGQVIDKRRMVSQALEEGRQAYLLRTITSQASIGKILFENGFRMAASQHLTGETTLDSIGQRKAMLRYFRDLSRRMETARLELLALADKAFD